MLLAALFTICTALYTEDVPPREVAICEYSIEGMEYPVEVSHDCTDNSCLALTALKRGIELPSDGGCDESHVPEEYCEALGGKNIPTRIYENEYGSEWHSGEELCRFSDGSYIESFSLVPRWNL